MLLLRSWDPIEESVDDGTGTKQVGCRSETWRWNTSRIACLSLSDISPGGRNKTPTAVGKNQEKLVLSLPIRLLQDLQCLSFERMSATSDLDRFGEVFEMGSVSCVLSTLLTRKSSST